MAPTESPEVHQYLWKDHGLPGYKNVMFTVNLRDGVICFAFYTALIAYTQRRSWVCIKSIGFRRTQPIQMRLDRNHPDSQERLSQIKAAKALIYGPSSKDLLTIVTISKFFGVAALVNMVLFFILGIVIPLALTGFFSTAVVQSKFTDKCTGHETDPTRARYTTQLADSYYKRCMVDAPTAPSCTQQPGIMATMPLLYRGTNWPCPFEADFCQNATHAVQFEHKGLTPRDYGVNLSPRVLIGHRVTCAPLKTEKFMHVRLKDDGASAKLSVLWFGYPPDVKPIIDPGISYGMALETANGPNSFSEDFSGNEMASTSRASPAYDLKVYPVGGNDTQKAEGLHPALQRTDGQVFIVVFRTGSSYYTSDQPIDDPFYSAHNKLPGNDSNTYMPDYEATALGCVEQFRLCVTGSGGFCTDWGRSGFDVIFPILTSDKLPRTYRLDFIFLYVYFTSMASMKRLFSLRIDPGMLITSFTRRGDTVDNINPSTQWMEEVKSWFLTAFITARYNFMQIVTRDNIKRTKDAPASMVRVCGLVLFQSNDYTNINFIGLLASVSAQLLICTFSFREEISHTGATVLDVIVTIWQLALYLYILLYRPRFRALWTTKNDLRFFTRSASDNSFQEVHGWHSNHSRLFRTAFWSRIKRRLGRSRPENEDVELSVRNSA